MTNDQQEPATLSTFGDLNRRGYRLDAWCPQCGRHERIDLAAMPQDKPYTTRLRCRCDGIAEIRLGWASKLGGYGQPA